MRGFPKRQLSSLILAILLTLSPLQAQEQQQQAEYKLDLIHQTIPSEEGWKEKDWQKAWMEIHGGQPLTLPDGTRADIVTETHAIEVDWGHKWAEGIGQALWYNIQTNKRAGLILIIKTEADKRALTRALSTIQHHQLNLTIWALD